MNAKPGGTSPIWKSSACSNGMEPVHPPFTASEGDPQYNPAKLRPYPATPYFHAHTKRKKAPNFCQSPHLTPCIKDTCNRVSLDPAKIRPFLAKRISVEAKAPRSEIQRHGHASRLSRNPLHRPRWPGRLTGAPNLPWRPPELLGGGLRRHRDRPTGAAPGQPCQALG